MSRLNCYQPVVLQPANGGAAIRLDVAGLLLSPRRPQATTNASRTGGGARHMLRDSVRTIGTAHSARVADVRGRGATRRANGSQQHTKRGADTVCGGLNMDVSAAWSTLRIHWSGLIDWSQIEVLRPPALRVIAVRSGWMHALRPGRASSRLATPSRHGRRRNLTLRAAAAAPQQPTKVRRTRRLRAAAWRTPQPRTGHGPAALLPTPAPLPRPTRTPLQTRRCTMTTPSTNSSSSCTARRWPTS